MIHIGIDHHKKYSHVVALKDSREVCFDGRLDSTPGAFAELKAEFPADKPVQSVLEAGRSPSTGHAQDEGSPRPASARGRLGRS